MKNEPAIIHCVFAFNRNAAPQNFVYGFKRAFATLEGATEYAAACRAGEKEIEGLEFRVLQERLNS